MRSVDERTEILFALVGDASYDASGATGTPLGLF